MTIRSGRPPVTSRDKLEQVALDLFADQGFVATTVDDIADVAGISRRTFFRYYESKNDVVWGDFEDLLGRMAQWLADVGDDVPMVDALSGAVVRFNSLVPDMVAAHRERMTLILRVPALQAHSTLRYAEWRHVIATFAARRLEVPVESFGPQLVGHLALGAALAAYEQWLADETADLGVVMASALAVLPTEAQVRDAT